MATSRAPIYRRQMPHLVDLRQCLARSTAACTSSHGAVDCKIALTTWHCIHNCWDKAPLQSYIDNAVAANLPGERLMSAIKVRTSPHQALVPDDKERLQANSTRSASVHEWEPDTGSSKIFLTIYKAIYQIAKLRKGRGMVCEMQPICYLPPVAQGSYDDDVSPAVISLRQRYRYPMLKA